MLRERATDIEALPDTLLDVGAQEQPGHGDPSLRTARRHLTVAAAAAAVVLAAGAALLAVRLTHSPTPAHPGPSPTATRPTPAPHGLSPLRCTAPLPAAWQQAMTAGTVSAPPGQVLVPQAVTDAGQVIVVQARDHLPTTFKLVLVAPHRPIRTLYETPWTFHGDGLGIGVVSTAGNLVAFDVGRHGPEQIVVVDIATGATTKLTLTTPNVLGPVVFDGAVYWTEIRGAQGTGHGSLYRYDMATGHRSTLDSHATSAPVVVGAAVHWNRGTISRATHEYRIDIASWPPGHVLPAGVDTSPIASGYPLLSDGRTYVWEQDTNAAIIAERPEDGGPVTIVPPERAANGSLVGLTGDLVWWGTSVLDLRTGAAARANKSGSGDVAAGHTAVIALAPNRVAVLDIATLPTLHC
jgi:hypothetical protein